MMAEQRSGTAIGVEQRPSVLSTKRLTRRDSQELAAQINLDRVLNYSVHGRLGDQSHAASQRHSRAHSWRNKSPFRHQESQRSVVSGPGGCSTAPCGAAPTVTGDDGREPSGSGPADGDGSSAAKPVPSAAVPSTVDTEDSTLSTPLGALSSRDPSLLLGVLQEAVARQKATLGAPGRHRCSPSVRSRLCAPHCLQILSARLFAVMCHDVTSQRQVIDGDHVRILVDALDPNHDPVSHPLHSLPYIPNN